MDFHKGDKVQWRWGSGTARGVVVEIFTDKVTHKIKGHEITRNATREEPACLVRQDDGDEALKSASELTRG